MHRARARLLPALLGLSAMFASSPARADEPEPVHRYADDRAPAPMTKPKVILLGLGVTAGFYAPVLGASYIWPERRGASDMRIPVAGPWMGMAQTRLCNKDPEQDPCSNFLRVTSAVLLALDGIGQAGGVGLMLEGLFLRTMREESASGSSRPVRSGFATHDRKPHFLGIHTKTFSMTPVPFVGNQDEVGVGFVGQF